MLRRLSYIENGKTLADSGELVSDITIRDPITSLWIRMSATTGGTTNAANTLFECISAIEIIDGAKVLTSLSGVQALALATYRLGRFPKQVISEVLSQPNDAHIPLWFGRHVGDQRYAFDPSKYLNPQFRIKWNLAAVKAVGASGFLSGSAVLTVLADVMEGGASPIGMIGAKQWYSWTTSNGGVEYIDLPIDAPYTEMLVRAQKATSYVDGVISKLKLSCDGGKFIPLEIDMNDLLFDMAAKGYTFEYRHMFHAGSGYTLYPLLKYEEHMALTSEDLVDCVFMYPDYGYGEAVLTMTVAGSNYTARCNIGALVTGMCPFRYVKVPLGLDPEQEVWFNAPAFRSVRLEATGAVASGSGEVVVGQILNY